MFSYRLHYKTRRLEVTDDRYRTDIVLLLNWFWLRMLRLFGKIRSNLLLGPRGRKYALYAAGEVLLVIFGILIALQVNNWSERSERLCEGQISESDQQS